MLGSATGYDQAAPVGAGLLPPEPLRKVPAFVPPGDECGVQSHRSPGSEERPGKGTGRQRAGRRTESWTECTAALRKPATGTGLVLVSEIFTVTETTTQLSWAVEGI